MISLFFLIIGVSGERKSSTDTLALAPLEVRREEFQRDYDVAFPEYKNTHDAWTAERQRILRMKGKGSAGVNARLSWTILALSLWLLNSQP